MEKDLMIRGFYRLSKIMQDMIGCNDKQEIIRLSNVFMDDVQELIALIYVENEIGDEDLEEFKQVISHIEKEAMAECSPMQSAILDGDELSGGFVSHAEDSIPARGEDLNAPVAPES
jgi:hypothetical protein